jgi:prepilin-type N-terminal cleavage/methylation domain-containing protein
MAGHLNGKSSRGFSLPEVVVVVAIIAILAAILIVLMTRARDNALVASCEQNERMIAAALDSYSVDHLGQYPTHTGDVTVDMFGGKGNPYFNHDNIVDPTSGLPYQYTNGPGTCTDPNTEYQIIDQGGHSSTSLLALLSADDQDDAIAFCSTRGLYALQYSSVVGGSMKPQNQQPQSTGGP